MISLSKVGVVTSIVCLVATAAAPVRAANSLPPGSAPAGMHAVEGDAGGRILDGALPKVASPDAAFRAGLARARGYFGAPARLAGVVRSNDGTMTLGLFRDSLGGTPVGGFVLTTFAAGGTSHVDVLFDRIDRVNRTMHGLLARTIALHPASAGGAAASAGTGAVALRATTSPDGSVHVALPDGWKTPVFAQGQFSAIGPAGEEVDQEVSIACSDPSGPMGSRAPNLLAPYSRDVATAYRSVMSALIARGANVPRATFSSVVPQQAPFPNASLAKVEGTSVRGGTTNHFSGFVLVSAPNPYGGWSISLKLVSAPVADFRRELPVLSAIYNSYGVDQRVRSGQVAETIQEDDAGMQRTAAVMASTRARNDAVFNASMNHAAAVQSGIDRSTSGFVHYLNDTTVLEGPSGERGTADSGFAQSVVGADPQNFRIVPVSEYRAGD